MHPAPFDYLAARSVDEACAALSLDPDGTRVLAGGQSLLPRLVRRLERPRRLVDITTVAELRGLRPTPHGLQIGAAVTQRTGELCSALRGFGLLAQALPRVGKVTTRNRGTICGSLAHANPAAELGVCLLALGGKIAGVSAEGFRRIAAEDFFVAPHRTALRADELLHTVTFHRPTGIGHFDEVTLRGAGDTPLVSAAVQAHVVDGTVTDMRIAVGGAGQIPMLAGAALTGALRGRLDDDTIEAAGRDFAADLEFAGDAHGSGDHRRRLAAHLVTRLLHRVKSELP